MKIDTKGRTVQTPGMPRHSGLLLALLLFTLLLLPPRVARADATESVSGTQTLQILGASGTAGSADPYVESSPDGGLTWRKAFLYSGHPWGNVAGTDNWLNCGPGGDYCVGIDTLYRVRFVMPDVFTDPQIAFEFKGDNYVGLTLNTTDLGYFESSGSVNGNPGNAALVPGTNEIRLLLHDTGGWAGLNFRVTISVQALSAPTLISAPDSILPVPTFQSDITAPTSGPVAVTIHYPADASEKTYSRNETDWFVYNNTSIVMLQNGTLYARWKDGNQTVSPTGSYMVSNIIPAPPAPLLIPDTVNPTLGPVVVSIDWGDTAVKMYRIDGGAWQDATAGSTVVMTANGTIEAQGTNDLDITSPIAQLSVANIVTDPSFLRIAFAAMNAAGTAVAVQFDRPLDQTAFLNKGSFHLQGTDKIVTGTAFVSDRTVMLHLSGSDSGPPQPIALAVDAGAVTDRNGKQVDAWPLLPVLPQAAALQLRSELLDDPSSGMDERIGIGQVLRYVASHPIIDVTGDGVGDRNDIQLLLLQITAGAEPE